MVSSSDIKKKIESLLADEISLDSFEDWLVQETWNIHKLGSQAAESLTFAVEESLSEYSSGHLTRKQLLQELGSLVHQDNKVVVFSLARVFSWEGLTASPTRLVSFLQPLAVFASTPHLQTSHQTNTLPPLLIR